MSRMTKETLRQIIHQVENDPLAGMGAFSKEDILVDRLLAHWNTVGPRDAQQPTAPKPILSDVSATTPTQPPATGPMSTPKPMSIGDKLAAATRAPVVG